MRRAFATLGASMVAALILSACTSTPDQAPSQHPAPLTEQQRSALSLSALQRLSAALASGDSATLAALAAPEVPGSGAELADLAANAAELGLHDLTFRFVTEAPQLDPGIPGEWAVTAEVSWQAHGESLEASLPVVLRAEQGDAAFITARVAGARETPIWVLGRVHVERTRGVEVVALQQTSLSRFSALAQQALVDLARDLPPLSRPLVLEVPASADGFAAALGSDPHDVAKLAAITVNQFGADHASVLVNPGVFETLGPTAAQIVISHEAVHVALNAAGSGMPMWLMEGYADFVALDAQDLTVTTSASQILAQVRSSGAPDHLPVRADFNATTHGVGAVYESAWLACKWIADHYGKQRLLQLYRAADAADDDRGPLQQVLGISRAELTAAWRAYLVDLTK